MSFKKAILQTTILFFLLLLLATLLDKLGFKFLLPDKPIIDFEKLIKEEGVGIFTITTLLLLLPAVFIEEVFFRLLPYKLFKKIIHRTVPYWIVGMITAALFSMIHTNSLDGLEFPLAQFIMGLYFWALIKLKKGFKLVLVNHLYYNLMGIVLALISYCLGI